VTSSQALGLLFGCTRHQAPSKQPVLTLSRCVGWLANFGIRRSKNSRQDTMSRFAGPLFGGAHAPTNLRLSRPGREIGCDGFNVAVRSECSGYLKQNSSFPSNHLFSHSLFCRLRQHTVSDLESSTRLAFWLHPTSSPEQAACSHTLSMC
jgi:hypothetical protein